MKQVLISLDFFLPGSMVDTEEHILGTIRLEVERRVSRPFNPKMMNTFAKAMAWGGEHVWILSLI